MPARTYERKTTTTKSKSPPQHKKKATNYQPKQQQACTCKLTVPSTVMRTPPWEIGWDNSTTILPCTSSCKKTHTEKEANFETHSAPNWARNHRIWNKTGRRIRRGGRRVPMVGICGLIGGAWSRSTSGIRKSETARFLPRRRETGFRRERVCVRVLINWPKDSSNCLRPCCVRPTVEGFDRVLILTTLFFNHLPYTRDGN